jgi:hypothetical protein
MHESSHGTTEPQTRRGLKKMPAMQLFGLSQERPTGQLSQTTHLPTVTHPVQVIRWRSTLVPASGAFALVAMRPCGTLNRS